MTVATAQIVKVQQAQFIACAYVYEGSSGAWIVQDETNSRGGLFANRESALKFVRHEYGSETVIVMTAPSMASDETVAARPNYLQLLTGARRLNSVVENLFNRHGRGRNVHAIADAANMKGCWDTAAQLLIRQSPMAAAAA